MPGPKVYDLTPLTRSFNQRRVVIQGFDVSLRSLIVFLIGLAPSLILTAISWTLFGMYALVMLAVGEVATFWLIEGRSRGGLRLKNYRALIDRKRSMSGSFICCWQPVDVTHGTWASVVAAAVPVERPTDARPSTDDDPFLYREPVAGLRSSRADRKHRERVSSAWSAISGRA
jgi:hypothetical protein